MDLKILKNCPPWDWPESAAGMFLRILRDDRADKSERRLAAELAGDFTVINDELVDALLSIARSGGEPESLRAEAVLSLGPALEHADTEGFNDPDDVPISEETFRGIQESLREIYMDPGVPKELRRLTLEASVRAPRDWHQYAVRDAYSGGDEDWRLTAVFCMQFVRGFDDRILEALESENRDIHYQAVCAAGNWGVDAAWPHIAGLITAGETDKPLLLAAIGAAACIRPLEAAEILVGLTDSDDEDVAEAACEAMAMAEVASDD